MILSTRHHSVQAKVVLKRIVLQERGENIRKTTILSKMVDIADNAIQEWRRLVNVLELSLPFLSGRAFQHSVQSITCCIKPNL